MNQLFWGEVPDLIRKHLLVSGFDLYYIGFSRSIMNIKLSPEEILALVENIIELHHNETINDQDKIKSFVRVLSKKMDQGLIENLVLKVESDDEGRIPLKDYFSQIMEIIQKEKNINKIELYYLGQFHANNPTFKISNLFKYVNCMMEIEKDNLNDDEKRFEFFKEILNKREKDHQNNEKSDILVDANHQNLITDERNIQNSSELRNNLKRRGDPSLTDNELKKMKLVQATNQQLERPKPDNEEARRKNQNNNIDSDYNPFNDLIVGYDKHNLESTINTKNHHQVLSEGLEEIPPEILKFVEMEQQELALKRLNTKEEEELSKALIAQLQNEEENVRMKAKEKLEEQNSANCAICLDDLYSTTFKPLEGCSHVFHEECMREYLKSKIDEKGFPILCPELECKSEIRLNDVADFMDETYKEKFESFSFKSYLEKNADEVSCCPTADCPFAFVKEDDQNQLQCPVCKKHYCLNCRVEWHKGMTCKEFEVSNKRDENDVKFEKFIKGQKYKQCPKCGFWVSRTEGCNAMICRCGTHFCYNCGKEGDGHVCPCLTQNRQGGLFGYMIFLIFY